jgi:hypothetical protein
MGERVGNYRQQQEASANAKVATAAVVKISFICARRYAFEPTWQQENHKNTEKVCTHPIPSTFAMMRRGLGSCSCSMCGE